jgi:hypothetical protein
MSNIFLMILLVIFVLYVLNRKNNEDNFHQDVRAIYKPKKNIDYLDELLQYSNDKQSLYSEEDTNLEFVESQFHNDYRDTITAFNNIAPSQKQIFNISNMPVDFSNPNSSQVKKLVNDFIKELNNNIIKEVPDYRTANSGWDELLEDPKLKENGWDKAMKSLGLPKNVYPDPAKKSKVKVIKIDHIEKYESEDEIKYNCFLFIKKCNVEDILVIKISFVLDKRIINEDRLFFNKNSSETKVVIEEIFILGYMTEKGVGRNNDFKDRFYNFSNLDKDGILDDKEIISQLNKKLAQRSAETQRFNDTLEPQFRNLKLGAPHLSNYNSYQATNTIYDDILKNKNFS